MFKLSFTLACYLLLLCTLLRPGLAERENAKPYVDHVVMRFEPKSIHQVSLLEERLPQITKGTADFWTDFIGPNHPVDVMIHKNYTQALMQFSRKFSLDKPYVVIEDVARMIISTEQEVNPSAIRDLIGEPNFDAFFQRYLGLEEIDLFVDKLASRYPHLVSREPDIGKSHEGREMKIFKISAKSNKSKKLVWIDAAVHAREWITISTVLYLALDFVSKYGLDRRITRLMDEFDFIILPVFNPDGYEFSRSRGRCWRKNRRCFNNSFCCGVDLNRNFKYNTIGWEVGSSNDTCNPTYQGESALSESESNAIASYLTSKSSQLEVYISFHSYSQLLLFPSGSSKERTKDFVALYTLARETVEVIQNTSGMTYAPLQASELYVSVGSSMDWVYENIKIIYCYAFELRPSNWNDSPGFLLPPIEIIPTGAEISAGMRYLLNRIIDNRKTNSTNLIPIN